MLKKVLISLLIAIIIISLGLGVIYEIKKCNDLKTQLPHQVGEVNSEKEIVFVKFSSKIYATSTGEEAVGTISDILSLSPEKTDSFYEESFGISIPYTAISNTGLRYCVSDENGTEYWVQPNASVADAVVDENIDSVVDANDIVE